MVTADLYSLVRAVKYDGNVIYYMSCATAFTDSTEGNWLSKTTAISNPYSGRNNPGTADCGEIKDSLRFRTGE